MASQGQSNEDKNEEIKKLISRFTYVDNSIPFTEFEAAPFQGEVRGWYKYQDVYIAKTSKPEAEFFTVQYIKNGLQFLDIRCITLLGIWSDHMASLIKIQQPRKKKEKFRI